MNVRHVAVASALAAGLGLTSILQLNRSEIEEAALEASFERDAREPMAALQFKLGALVQEGVALSDYLATIQGDITRSRFRQFVTPSLARQPAIQALEWIPRVFDAPRRQYERAAVESGLVDFQIRQKLDGKLVPASQREEYFPVYYVEPLQGNEGALGFDLASNPTRKAALKRASESGKTTATAAIVLVQESGNQKGFLLFYPVYENETAKVVPNSPELRRERLLGFALGVYRIGDLVERTLSEAVKRNFHFELGDASSAEPSPLYASSPSGSPSSSSRQLSQGGELEVADRRWSVRVKPTAHYLNTRMVGAGSKVWMWSGILLSFVVGLLINALLGRRELVHASVAAKAREMTLAKEKSLLEERLDAEDRLRVATAELRAQQFAVDQHSIVGITDRQGVIVYANDKFCEVSQYSRQELLGQNHSIINSGHHSRDFWKTAWRTIGNGEVWKAEVKNQAKDGSHYWVDTTIVPSRDSNGKIHRYIAIRTEITERKREAVELAMAKETAEAAVQLKSEFLANMSHEIRTPMNGVIGMIGLLLQTRLSPDQRDQAETARTSADALLAVINDILDFSKIEAGKLDIEPEPHDLLMVVEDAAELLAVAAHEKGLNIIVRRSANAPRYIVGDAGRIRQVTLNLLSNAVKFTLQGHVLVNIEGESFGERSRVRISVTDTGIGLKPDEVTRIFDKFSQADGSTTRKFGGTGLGLSISRQLAVLMGGDVGVTSDFGKGSCFHFTLNVPTWTKGKEENRPEPKNLTGVRILAVGPVAAVRTFLAHELTDAGAEVTEAASTVDATAFLKQSELNERPYHIVLLDKTVAFGSAGGLLEGTQRRPELNLAKIVLITDTQSPANDDTLLKAGISAILGKPIRPSQLVELVWKVDQVKPTSFVSEPLIRARKLLSGAQEDLFPIPSSEDRLRLLVVDDNAINQKVAKKVLEKLGYQVDLAGNGLEAIDMVQRFPYDAVLMDCQMPEMDGFEATTKIRALLGADMPILAMTANAMQSDEDACLAVGMNGFITKPLNVSRLQETLRQWVKSGKEAELTDGRASRANS